YCNKKLFINKTTFIEGINEEIMETRIGLYNPVLHFLKSRKNKLLSDNELENCTRIINSLRGSASIIIKIDDLTSNLF
ncbi:MAG: hypothetical protein JXA60_01460, partial [Candidatus Coatesbacteria bacterium]|nr:hypothetical protein [Candidatus Coatesbacteria bacterium]